MSDYDVLVLGGGPGGYVSAIRCAQLGAKVCLVEKDELGGTCLNRGCIPTKDLVYLSELKKTVEGSKRYMKSRDLKFEFDMEKVHEKKDKTVKNLVKGVKFLLKKNRVTLIKGKGRLNSGTEIEVDVEGGGSEKIVGKNMIIATGSAPLDIAGFNIDGKKIINSDHALKLKEYPKSITIVGAGAIGCEFANIFSNFGAKVTLVELLNSILPMCDKDVSKEIARVFRKKKIKTLTGKKIETIENSDRKVILKFEDGETLKDEMCLVSIGRKPCSEDIGLEKVGIEVENGLIKTDEHCKTNIKNIYSIGDVTGKSMLAHVASKQGLVAADNIMGKEAEIDYNVIPNCVFTEPRVAYVGIREKEVEERGIDYEIGFFLFRALGISQIASQLDGFTKIIAEKKTEKILGVHIVGPHATELIMECALAIQEGIPISRLSKLIHPHPTFSESTAEAVEDWFGLAIHI